jgi:hypothetical protein
LLASIGVSTPDFPIRSCSGGALKGRDVGRRENSGSWPGGRQDETPGDECRCTCSIGPCVESQNCFLGAFPRVKRSREVWRQVGRVADVLACIRLTARSTVKIPRCKLMGQPSRFQQVVWNCGHNGREFMTLTMQESDLLDAVPQFQPQDKQIPSSSLLRFITSPLHPLDRRTQSDIISPSPSPRNPC